MRHRKGDTLIEVVLAVGIFSMVAVSVVAVVSGSTTSAQTALETTIAREEIDAQAEALRFIQASYIAGGKSNSAGNTKYVTLWNAIVKLANTNANYSGDSLTFAPTTCDELYNLNTLTGQGAFILNTRKMSTEDPNEIILTPGTDSASTLFHSASESYPRILYLTNTPANENGTMIYDPDMTDTVSRVEGIYIVPVRDRNTTHIVGVPSDTAAYYDFYIRTCWFGPGADKPSTIQTVIRLYDPEVISY